MCITIPHDCQSSWRQSLLKAVLRFPDTGSPGCIISSDRLCDLCHRWLLSLMCNLGNTRVYYSLRGDIIDILSLQFLLYNKVKHEKFIFLMF